MIVLKNICKVLGGKKILDDISFHIAPNENVGIIGLNGAGKTTLLNIIAGVLKPDSGFIRVNHTEVLSEKFSALKEISYVSGTKSQLWADLTVQSSFENAACMYGIDRRTFMERLKELDEIFEIRELSDSVLQNLSLGERMRCELVYALLNRPKLLMLDEAMIGLDVSAKYRIMQYFEKYRPEKKSTVIYTSHNFSEVEKLCDRIILIDKGRIIFDGSIHRIMKEFAPLYRMELRILGAIPDFEDLPIQKFVMEKDVLTIDYDKHKIDSAQLLKHIMAKSRIADVKLYEPDLESTIKKVYGRME